MGEKVCVVGGCGNAGRVALASALTESNQRVVLAVPESFENKVQAKFDEEQQIQRIMKELSVGVERRRYGMAKFKKKKEKKHARQRK